MSVIEIEIAGSNRSAFFPPLYRVLRGELNVDKISEPSARSLSIDFPKPIPGMKLTLDAKSGIGSISDPLYTPEHKVTREAVERRRMKLGPEHEEFADVHVPSWLHEMKKLVDAGAARLLIGKFPDPLPPGATKRYLTMDGPDYEDAQTLVMEKLTAALDRFADTMASLKTNGDEK